MKPIVTLSAMLLIMAPSAAPSLAQEFASQMPAVSAILAHTRTLKEAPVPCSLEELLKDLDDADPMVRLLAIQQLAPYVKTEMVVRKRLTLCFADSAVEIRALTIVTLGSVAMEDDTIRLAIQELFLRDDDDAIKLSGMEVLWPLITTDSAVRARILKILKTPIRSIDDLFVVDQAVISVMNVSVISTDAEISDAVLSILAYDDSWFLSGGLISTTAGLALKPVCHVPDIQIALQAAAARKVDGAIETLAACTTPANAPMEKDMNDILDPMAHGPYEQGF